MSRITVLKHRFVEFIPDTVENGTIYVSVEYATAVHRCCCGCGHEVVTPLSPTDWILSFDGRSVSLHPSIGNWSFPCQSHYWIRRNTIAWAPRWTAGQIAAGREYDSSAKQDYFDTVEISSGERDTRTADEAVPQAGLWERFRRWLAGKDG